MPRFGVDKKGRSAFSVAARLFAQGWQSNAGGFKPAIGGKNLSGDEACAVRAQEDDSFGDLAFRAVPVEGQRIVVGGNDLGAMDGHRKSGAHRARGHAIGAHAVFAKFDSVLKGKLDHRRL